MNVKPFSILDRLRIFSGAWASGGVGQRFGAIYGVENQSAKQRRRRNAAGSADRLSLMVGTVYEPLVNATLGNVANAANSWLESRPRRGYAMNDETAAGSAGTPHGEGHSGRNAGEQSPLQARAQFLKNRRWELIIGLNQGACARGGAQHGFNRETQAACAKDWATKQSQTLSLGETIDFLRQCHRRAPFLFFNGNTFAAVGRQIAAALFADLPAARRREIISAVAHYIAGVLDRESMVEIVESLCASTDLRPGDCVKTLRGSLRGVILRILSDGRVVWRPDGSQSRLIALPESLVRA